MGGSGIQQTALLHCSMLRSYLYIYIYICTYTYIYIYICFYLYLYLHVYLSTCIICIGSCIYLPIYLFDHFLFIYQMSPHVFFVQFCAGAPGSKCHRRHPGKEPWGPKEPPKKWGLGFRVLGFGFWVQNLGAFPRLGGSWYLLTTYSCTYNPLISPLSALI